MRELRFIVDGQNIRKDENCDFSGIVAGTKGYLQAKFLLPREWQGCIIAASFFLLSQEYPVILGSDGKCEIPKEALIWDYFDVQLTGINNSKGYKIVTNKVRVEQERVV